MKPSTLIVWLLVAACIAIDLAMIGELQVRHDDWPGAGGVVGLGLVFSQIALVALWTVWGRTHILVRGVVTLLSIWAVSYLASYSEAGGQGNIGKWFGMLLVYCGASLVPLVIARLKNFGLCNKDVGKPPVAKSRLSSNQFTIWGLLSLMTAVGITLAVARFAEFPVRQLAGAVAFFTLLAATVCTVLWLGLFLSRLRYAIIVTIVICPIVGILLPLAPLGVGVEPLEFALMMCVQGGATLSAAAILRAVGFRLVRNAPLSETTASESSDDSAPVTADQRGEP